MKLERRAKITQGGRIVIPSEFRKALGVTCGDELVLTLEDESVRLTSLSAEIALAQRTARRFIPSGTMLSEELIADRRRESARE